MHKIYLLFFFLAFTIVGKAQNLTGTWEGNIPDSQFLQINIMHTKKGICGFTFDSVINSKNDFCKTYFNAYYNKKQKDFYIIGIEFIENSGSHFFIDLHFDYKADSTGEFLKEFISIDSLNKRIRNGEDTEPIILRKVSNTPSQSIKGVYDLCMEKPNRKLKKDFTLTKVPITKIVIDTQNVNKLQPIQADTTAKVKTPSIEKQLLERKSKLVETIKIKNPMLSFTIYDDAYVDGDTISIFHNKKLLVYRQLLSKKGIEVTIDLGNQKGTHEIVLFAHNLGSIPPNTALVIINAGKKTYELRAEADLNKNATLIFEYEPSK